MKKKNNSRNKKKVARIQVDYKSSEKKISKVKKRNIKNEKKIKKEFKFPKFEKNVLRVKNNTQKENKRIAACSINRKRTKRNRTNLKLINKKALLIIVICIIALILAIFNINNKKDINLISPKISRIEGYDEVLDKDNEVYGKEEGGITQKRINVNFDAFFLEESIDGVAKKVRGTCNKVGEQSNLYMDLSVFGGGKLKNATITVNSNNFYLKTSFVKDGYISSNCISNNTKTIKLGEIDDSMQKLFIGSVCSGYYTSISTQNSAIGNDTSKYSMENSIIFAGTYEDEDGKIINFEKEIPFVVDWYGEVDCSITPKQQSISSSNFKDLVEGEEFNLEFTVTTEESKNELILSEANLSGTIPELNGYKATKLEITGNGVDYTYDEKTGEFTAKKVAVLDENGIVTSNAYNTETNYYTKTVRSNKFDFKVTYPIEAYNSITENKSEFELLIPMEAQNKGFNNPNTKDGFNNPYVSNVDKGIVVINWKEKSDEEEIPPSFGIAIGTYKKEGYNAYLIHKDKPLNIYNGVSLEEKDDEYVVEWKAYTGNIGETDGLIMNEITGKSDEFLDVSGNYISMEKMTTNKGIYFVGATDTLGNDGWIKVYDNQTNTLLKTFTSSDWNNYNNEKPYYYDSSVKHVRVETSSTIDNSYIYTRHIKELDDEVITETFSKAEFDELLYIYTSLTGGFIQKETGKIFNTEDIQEKAKYVAPRSVAYIYLSKDTIATNVTTENEIITIVTETDKYNECKWKNGTFLVRIPKDMSLVEINNVKVDDENVEISAYDVYELNGDWYIKIITKNEKEASYRIAIDCNLVPDQRAVKTTDTIELYATNGIPCEYTSSSEDKYDLDEDSNITEIVNYAETNLTLETGTSLNTTQLASDYDDENKVVIAPRVVKINNNRNATITVSLTNNYDSDVTDLKILGIVPFEGNKNLMSGQDLGSEFTSYMKSGGFFEMTPEVEPYTKIYYSKNETPTNNKDLPENGWILADDTKNWTQDDWNEVKTYLIVIDKEYVLKKGDKVDFKYQISIPDGIPFNLTTYSQHNVDFALAAEEGLVYTGTGSSKLGFMVAKQYDLEIVKYQENSNKKIPGVVFSVREKGQNSSTVRFTDENGVILVTELLAGKHYILKEERISDQYVLNNEEIEFYTYTDENENLYIAYLNSDGTNSKLEDVYSSVRSTEVLGQELNKDYKIRINVEDEAKLNLLIQKKDNITKEPLKDIRFVINGKGKNRQIIKTDENGKVFVSGIELDEEYTITEIKAPGYNLPSEEIVFSVTRTKNTGNAVYNFTKYVDNGTTTNHLVGFDENENLVVELDLENQKFPTYDLKLIKYSTTGEILPGAQYKIYGEGINASGQTYTTDENGIIVINGLYECSDESDTSKTYTIYETYAPEGYSINNTRLTFKAYRDGAGNLIFTPIEGNSVIRDNKENGSKDIQIIENNIVQIGVEDEVIFGLHKVDEDTGEKLSGAKFIIKDLEGNDVLDSEGNPVGEHIEAQIEHVNIKAELKDISQYISFTSILDSNEYGWEEVDENKNPKEGTRIWRTKNYNQNSGISTMESAPFSIDSNKTLSFEWFISSERSYDKAYYQIINADTNEVVTTSSNESGENGENNDTMYNEFSFKKVTLKNSLPSGNYKIKFIYNKDSSVNKGADRVYVRNVKVFENDREYEYKYVTEYSYEPVSGYGFTTDENGRISALLPAGKYKAIEVEAPKGYILPENEEDRTYYFEIGLEKDNKPEYLINAITGNNWNYINSVTSNIGATGGVVAVGSISDSVVKSEDGVDVNGDGIKEHISKGYNDAIIVSYDREGKYVSSKTFGGKRDDAFNKIIQTSDGGYAAVGYVSSDEIYLGDKKIESISKTDSTSKNKYEDTLKNKDAVLVKFTQNFDVDWAVRFGGTSDDEIDSIIEIKTEGEHQGDLIIAGKYYSKTFNFYDAIGKDLYNAKESFENLGNMDGFIASYSQEGMYRWSQRIGGKRDVYVSDITETESGIAIAVNGILSANQEYNSAFLTTDNKVSFGANVRRTGVSGIVSLYNLEGANIDYYGIYPSSEGSNTYSAMISSIENTKDNRLLVAVNYTNTVRGSKTGLGATTIIGTNPTSYKYDATIMELNKEDASYKKIVHTLSSNHDDFISSIKSTEDGGLLIGGWYYSANGLDVDGDGTLTGEYDFKERTQDFTSEGFIIKLDSNEKVDYSSNILGGGYENIEEVTETDDGNYVACGNFNSNTLNATNFKKEETDNSTNLISNAPNYSNGFVAIKTAKPPIEFLSGDNITITNKAKSYKITTEVRAHDENGTEVKGGKISGKIGTIDGETDGVKYTETGMHFVERVNHGKNQSEETKIVITPDSGYSIKTVEVNGKTINNFNVDENGVGTLNIFKNVTENIHVVVEFSKKEMILELIVNHYLWTGNVATSVEKILPSEHYTGVENEKYLTMPNLDTDYDIIINNDFYAGKTDQEILDLLNVDSFESLNYENKDEFLNDIYLPENYMGVYKTETPQIIVNYYYKEKTYTLTVHHYLESTDTPVPLKDINSGISLDPDDRYVNNTYHMDDPYDTTKATEERIDYSKYELVEIPKNATGNIKQNTEVIYYYREKESKKYDMPSTGGMGNYIYYFIGGIITLGSIIVIFKKKKIK